MAADRRAGAGARRTAGMRVLIVGAGFGGHRAPRSSCSATASTTSRSSTRRPALGGTWRHNSYPGAACDVPSHLYSFSYAQRRDWSRLCSPQHGDPRLPARRRARLRRRPAGSSPDTRRRRPAPGTTRGAAGASPPRTAAAWEADARRRSPPASCTSPRSRAIEGVETFAGHSFHSAEWDHDYDLRGKRVAVIGTGASAVQFVPEIAEQAARLVVFQRTGNWFLPRKNRAYPRLAQGDLPARPRRAGVPAPVHVPLLRVADADDPPPAHVGPARRACARRLFMRWQLRDPRAAAQGLARLHVRLQADPVQLARSCRRCSGPNVELVTDADRRALTRARRRHRRRPRARGRLHHLRHRLQDQRLHVPDGRSPAPAAARCARTGRTARTRTSGMTVPGFPSLFVMYGPNTNTSGGSIIVYLEAQAAYIRQALRAGRATRRGGDRRAPGGRGRQRPRRCRPRFAGTAWTRCDSWYRDAGRADRRQLAGLHARLLRAHARARSRRVRVPRASCLSTIAFFPEGAYGPTNNCVGIGDVLRSRGHRVVFIVEESFAGTLEARASRSG